MVNDQDDGGTNRQVTWPALLGAVGGLAAVVANLAQIDAWITSGIWAILRVALFVALLGFAVWCYRENNRRRKLTTGIAATVAGVLLLIAAAVLPQSHTSRDGDGRLTGSEADNAIGNTPQSDTRGTLHSRKEWAGDVNRVCRRHEKEMGEFYSTFAVAGAKLVQIGEKYYKYEDPVKGMPERIENKFLREAAGPIKDATPALAKASNELAAIEAEIAGLKWPTRPSDEELARSWWKLYRERAEKFDEVYQHFGEYLANTLPEVRMETFTKLILAVLDVNEKKEDFQALGRSLGIEYCR